MSVTWPQRVGSEVGPSTTLRFGESFPIQAVLIPALFAEGERTRAFSVHIMRALARRGVGSLLVELAGLGESPEALPRDIESWRTGARGAAESAGATWSLGIRGGGLVDTAFPPDRRYRVAPVAGSALARDLARAAAIDAAEAGRPLGISDVAASARQAGARLAGYDVPAGLFASLEAADLDVCGRVLRLAGDARPADARAEGPLLWRQSEPDDARALADAIAEDFASWVQR